MLAPMRKGVFMDVLKPDCERSEPSGSDPDVVKRWLRFLFRVVLAVSKTARLADQDFLTFRTGDFHIGLIDTNVRLTPPRMKRLATRFADERLFTKTALDHGLLPAA